MRNSNNGQTSAAGLQVLSTKEHERVSSGNFEPYMRKAREVLQNQNLSKEGRDCIGAISDHIIQSQSSEKNAADKKTLATRAKDLGGAAASGITTTFVSAPIAAGTTVALAPLFFLTWFLDVYNAVERKNPNSGVVSIVHDMRFEAIHNLFRDFIGNTNELLVNQASMPARKYIDDHFFRFFEKENAKYPGEEYPITRELLAMVKPDPSPAAPLNHNPLSGTQQGVSI